LRSRLPVLRPRRRYVIFVAESEEPLSSKDLTQEIRSAQISLFGDKGAASNSLKLISFRAGLGILRCGHLHIQQTRAVLATIFSVGGIRAAIHVKGVSGTIKSGTEKYIPKLCKISAESEERRIELEEVSGCIIHSRGCEIDINPDERTPGLGSDTRYLGLTSFDLCGGHDDADGTSDGL
jgi:ribonuclease P/MRP protein subunit POP5